MENGKIDKQEIESQSDWKAVADEKRESVLSLIPPEWKIENQPSPEDQPDISSDYMRGFLTAEEVEITETDAVGIAAKTTTGVWKSVDVTRAFCHRAALAAQLVCKYFTVTSLHHGRSYNYNKHKP